MSSRRPVLYLIDASSYVYRAFFALPPLTTAKGVPTNAVYGITTMLLKLLREAAPQYIGVVFDAPGPTFRDDLFDQYKANRPAMPDDLAAQLPLVQEVIAAFRLHATTLAGVEADDVIGTVVERIAGAAADVVIITADKDLMQLVTPHVHLWDTMRDKRCDVQGVRQRFGVNPEQVVDVMGLMGDAVDNIPGIAGIGEKTASALIQRFGSIDNLLAHLDELERATDIRGAKKLAATLREHAETARLSRRLAVVRRDVPIECRLEDFRYERPDPQTLRPLFTRLEFQKLIRELSATIPSAPTPLRAAAAAEAPGLAAAIAAGGRMAFACEVDATGSGLAGLIIAGADGAPIAVPPDAPAIAALLDDPRVLKISHDVKHELRALDGEGVPRVAPVFDVMIASYLLEATATHQLEDLAATVLGRQMAPFHSSRECLASGVGLLPALHGDLAPRLRDGGLEPLFYDIETPLATVLARMEHRGVRVDVPALQAMGRDIDVRLAATMAAIHELAGGPFNISSPPQLREVLFDRLKLSRKGIRRGKTGLSTDVDVLTRLAAEHPLPAKILEYRALAKLKSTYIDALPAAVNPRTARLHTSFNQTVAATGRLSSSDPNLQNIPIRGEEGRRIRAVFIADPGHVLISADYSQIELRVLAHLSEDPVLVAGFQSGEDVHARTAAEMFGVERAAVTADMRRAAKVINFGILYGMGPQRVARELDIPLADAERYIVSYFAKHAGVRTYLDRTLAEARTCGYVTTLMQRRRSLPDLQSRHRGLVQAAERTATNTPIQGSAADLIKMAMVALDQRLAGEGLDAAMILQVHDELVFEVAENDQERATALIREEMEAVYPLRVPLRVDIGCGQNWAEAH